MLERRLRAARGRGRADAGRRPGDACSSCSARSRRCTSRSARPLHRRPRRRDAERSRVQVGSSPRGSLALLKLVAGRAALRGRDFVTPDDVKTVAVPALAHRLTLRPELWVQRRRARTSSRECLDERADAGGRGRRSPRRDPRGDSEARAATRRWPPSGFRRARARPAGARRARDAVRARAGDRARSRRGRSSSRRELGARPRAPARGRHVDAARLELSAEQAVERLELSLALPDGSSPRRRTRSSIRLARGRAARARGAAALPALGRYQVGRVRLARARPVRPVRLRGQLPASHCGCTCIRSEETLAAAPAPARHPGVRRQPRRPAEGRGDRVRRPPPVPARRPRPARELAGDGAARRAVVNEEHPERNADIVLFLDSFAEARLGDRGRSTSACGRPPRSRRLPAAARPRRARALRRLLNWLTATSGTTQLYRIVDALLDTEVVLSYVWRDIDVIPTRTLPPKALVLALTPLLDERMVNALLDLRARGSDLAVDRDRAGPVRRRGQDRDRAARLPDLEAAARRAPPQSASSASRSSSGAGRPAGARPGGGVVIQALRQGVRA